jgi:copper chaperone CopZ
MRIILAVLLTLTATSAQAETIIANVNGMVCAMCVTGIEKSFRKVTAVDVVKVDLETKRVTLRTKDGQSLDDATVTKTIVNAGYAVTAITRSR